MKLNINHLDSTHIFAVDYIAALIDNLPNFTCIIYHVIATTMDKSESYSIEDRGRGLKTIDFLALTA